jgi:hypothetical protein
MRRRIDPLNFDPFFSHINKLILATHGVHGDTTTKQWLLLWLATSNHLCGGEQLSKELLLRVVARPTGGKNIVVLVHFTLIL